MMRMVKLLLLLFRVEVRQSNSQRINAQVDTIRCPLLGRQARPVPLRQPSPWRFMSAASVEHAPWRRTSCASCHAKSQPQGRGTQKGNYNAKNPTELTNGWATRLCCIDVLMNKLIG